MNKHEPPPLSPEELERYARHIVLAEIGGPGQQKLKRERVLVIGAGGLGAPVLSYLAAVGIGTLGIVDDDTVSLSNLASAAAAIQGINPHVAVETHRLRLDAGNAKRLVAGYDIVVDGSDNFETRYAVADACAAEERPLVTASVGRFDGSLTVLMPYSRDKEGRPNPTYRDLFPAKPPEGMVPNCAEAGVIGALTGVLGTLQAMEVVKLVTGVGEPLVGRLLLYDSLSTRFETIRYRHHG
ncbi:MAG: molybdopterin-synthase adenylyltransferase MoeB [Rhizobiales bacterium]|nr:molybdopterin-synthase adenylyltransferase MoeB [Hyphomicrobiales bacterium]